MTSRPASQRPRGCDIARRARSSSGARVTPMRARTVELHGRAHGLLAAVCTLDRHDEPQVRTCGSCTTCVDAIDRRERHVVRAEPLDPVLQRLTRELRVELQRRALRSCRCGAWRVREARVARRARGASSAATRPCQNFSSDDRWIAISRRRRCAGCRPARGAADRSSVGASPSAKNAANGSTAKCAIASSIETSTSAPAAGAAALEQRAEDAVGRIDAGDRIGERRAEEARPLRIDDHAQKAAQRLRDRVVARAGPRTGRSRRSR